MLRALCCPIRLAALTGCAGQAAAPAPTTRVDDLDGGGA